MKLLYILLFISTCCVAQAPNDCVGAILLCGDTDLGLTPNGIGDNEFAQPGNITPSCYNFQAPQAWFKVEVETTGTFEFTLSPDEPQADYDFAVFGPTTDCSNLGVAIRCSSTNPAAAGVTGDTGLNATETDFSEGPSALGNGFLAALNVQAGETYYIIVGLAVGNGGFNMEVGGTTQLPPSPTANDVMDMELCDTVGTEDGITEFNLAGATPQVLLTQNQVDVSYHETLNDANIGINPLPLDYLNVSNPQTIFLRAERTDSNCTDFTEFELRVRTGNEDTILDTRVLCTDAVTVNFDLNTIAIENFSDLASLNIGYFLDFDDALNDINPQSSVIMVGATETTYFIKANDPSNTVCDVIITAPIVAEAPPTIQIPVDTQYCDDDFDGSLTIDLDDFTDQILEGLPGMYTTTYYFNPADRDAAINAVNNPLAGNNNNNRLYVSVRDRDSGCTSELDFTYRIEEIPDLRAQEPQVICTNLNNPVILMVERGFDFYEWSTGENGNDLTTIEVATPGTYTVEVFNTTGCSTVLEFMVEPSAPAIIEDIIISDFQSGNNSATIIVSGTGNYEFKVDETDFQDSNFFDRLYRGFHELTVRDKNGCGSITETFITLDFARFFTPNNDGFNDRWTIEALSEFPDAVVKIYDRHGKFIKQISPEGAGWDGMYRNQLLPSSTYWFTLQIPGRPQVRGYFALKR
ncbi:MAG: T9SS type B sorting domain-containing protein [Nonlabens sp.]